STCLLLQWGTDTASWQGTSSPAQPRDECACPGELFFIKRRTLRIAAIAHRFKRRIDLAECGFGHAGVSPPFGKDHQRDAFIAKRHGPLERRPFAGEFLQRFAIGSNGLFELRRPALALPKEV